MAIGEGKKNQNLNPNLIYKNELKMDNRFVCINKNIKLLEKYRRKSLKSRAKQRVLRPELKT